MRSELLTELRWRSRVGPGSASQAAPGAAAAIMPAATVALSALSMRMNEPVVRFWA